jgi:hypothetical protein
MQKKRYRSGLKVLNLWHPQYKIKGVVWSHMESGKRKKSCGPEEIPDELKHLKVKEKRSWQGDWEGEVREEEEIQEKY